MQAWLQERELEGVVGAMRNLGVYSVQDIFMLDEKVGALPTMSVYHGLLHTPSLVQEGWTRLGPS